MNSKLRNSNIEIVRILSMFLIFMHHMVYHGGVSVWTNDGVNGFVQQLFFNGGKVGITTFTFIAGYFLIESKFSYKRLFKIIVEMFIFSIGFFLMEIIMNPTNLTFWGVLKQLMPVTYETWWYMTTYLVLYFLSPYLNKMLKAINKRDYLILLIVLLYIYCFAPSFLNTSPTYSNLIWFIFLYALAGFIRLYPLPSLKKFNFIYLLVAVGMYVGTTLITTYTLDNPFHSKFPISYTAMNSFNMLLVSFGLVMFAINSKPHYSKIINYACLGVMEVYLIHENPYFRKVLFEKIYDVSSIEFNNNWWIRYSLVGCLMFISLLIIGAIIRILLNLSINKLIDKIPNVKIAEDR